MDRVIEILQHQRCRTRHSFGNKDHWIGLQAWMASQKLKHDLNEDAGIAIHVISIDAWSRRAMAADKRSRSPARHVQEVGNFVHGIGIVGDHVVVGAGNRIGI